MFWSELSHVVNPTGGPPRACPFVSTLFIIHQHGQAKAEASAAAASAGADADRSKSATIPLTSGRALAVGYLQALIDSTRALGGGGEAGGGEGGEGGREGEVTSALHDELAYLLMEGLLVSFWPSPSIGAPFFQPFQEHTVVFWNKNDLQLARNSWRIGKKG